MDKSINTVMAPMPVLLPARFLLSLLADFPIRGGFPACYFFRGASSVFDGPSQKRPFCLS